MRRGKHFSFLIFEPPLCESSSRNLQKMKLYYKHFYILLKKQNEKHESYCSFSFYLYLWLSMWLSIYKVKIILTWKRTPVSTLKALHQNVLIVAQEKYIYGEGNLTEIYLWRGDLRENILMERRSHRKYIYERCCKNKSRNEWVRSSPNDDSGESKGFFEWFGRSDVVRTWKNK